MIPLMTGKLYYGDNLDVLRHPRHIPSESVDLVYIDPPFNSKRNYNQIYNNIGSEDHAQAQAFVDTWTWDDLAAEGYNEILANDSGAFTPQTVNLVKGLESVLTRGSLLGYLVNMTLRLNAIRDPPRAQRDRKHVSTLRPIRKPLPEASYGWRFRGTWWRISE